MILLPSEKISKAKRLIDNVEYEEALAYLNDLEQTEALTLDERLNIQGIKSYLFFWLGKFELALNTAETLYQTSQEFNKALFSFDALHVKRLVFATRGRWDEFFKNVEVSNNLIKSISQEDLLAYPQLEADMDFKYAVRDFGLGKHDQSLEYAEKCLAYYEKNDPLSLMIPFIVYIKGWNYLFKGEINLALACGERAISLIPKSKSRDPLFIKADLYLLMGGLYYQKGDLDLALEHLISSLEIFKKFEVGYWIGTTYYYIVLNFLLKKENGEAQRYLHEFTLLKEKHESFNYWYQLTNALILKSSSRMRDHTEAEHILKNLIKISKSPTFTSLYLIQLCDIYFQEFQFTNQMEILDDIHPLLNLLLQNARKTNSHYQLANGKLFQAKLALLQINLVEARRLLAEAQKIADEHGLQLLANDISREHDKLLEELSLWESFKKTQASVAERLKFASIDGVLEHLQGRGVIEVPEVSVEEPILLLIMDKSGASYFTHSFIGDWDFDDLFSSFMSAFNTFSTEIFSNSIDRVKIADNTILINPIEPFLACYIIKGQSYPAQQKLARFTKAIRASSEIWQALNKSVRTNEMLGLDKHPMLKTVIDEIF